MVREAMMGWRAIGGIPMVFVAGWSAVAAPATPPAATVAAAAQAASGSPGGNRLVLTQAANVVPSSPPGAGQPRDAQGSRDHPAVGRYQGARIVAYRQQQYEAARLFKAAVANARQPGKAEFATVEGRVTDILYLAPTDRSPLEIFRSYQKALADAGFATMWTCTPENCRDTALALKEAMNMPQIAIQREGSYVLAASRRSDGVRLNLAVAPYTRYEPRIMLRVVEPAAMEAGVRTLAAADIGRDVAQLGRAVLYAVQFDTDKATLRPESDAQLRQIADWLKASKVRALVVGHTDSQGAFAYNVGLSQRRADAVVAALTARFGVDRGQVTAFGAGMAAPVASNRTPDGRARNRRVEVVEQP